MMLVLLGLNIKKLFNFYSTNHFPKFWLLPDNLLPQQFKKPSAKRLSKKGTRIHNIKYKQA